MGMDATTTRRCVIQRIWRVNDVTVLWTLCSGSATVQPRGNPHRQGTVSQDSSVECPLDSPFSDSHLFRLSHSLSLSLPLYFVSFLSSLLPFLTPRPNPHNVRPTGHACLRARPCPRHIRTQRGSKVHSGQGLEVLCRRGLGQLDRRRWSLLPHKALFRG